MNTLTGANFIGPRESRQGGSRFAGRIPLQAPTSTRGSHSRATSVGTAAILRFARPVCFRNVPDSALPEELRNANPRGLWRLVDGQPTREAV
jgi:hypothetical protein